MPKDFNKWNLKKVNIHNYNSYPLYNQREIWWCLLGTNIGLEHDGDTKENTRPVLILKGLSKNICFVIPLTSSKKEHNMRVPIGNIEGRDAKAVISQLRVVDTKRLVEKICYLDIEKFELTRKAIKDIL